MIPDPSIFMAGRIQYTHYDTQYYFYENRREYKDSPYELRYEDGVTGLARKGGM
jgi:hypothetical protein